MEINNIYNMDCNKGMKNMIKEKIKVDLIIADPPYVISKKITISYNERQKKS